LGGGEHSRERTTGGSRPLRSREASEGGAEKREPKEEEKLTKKGGQENQRIREKA